MESIDMCRLLPQMGNLHKFLTDTQEEARRLFGCQLNLQFEDVTYSLAIDAVAKLVSDTLSVPMNWILSESRELIHVEARWAVHYLANKYIKGLKPPMLSQYFGKERTSANHAKQRVDELLSIKDEQMTAKIAACETVLLKRINGE